MKYLFHPAAKKEFYETIDYYEDCQMGLGLEFVKELYNAIDRIIRFPDAWPQFSNNTRRCLTNRFPFGIIYQIINNEIFIIAIMQLNRKPNYWKKRIN